MNIIRILSLPKKNKMSELFETIRRLIYPKKGGDYKEKFRQLSGQ